MFARLLEFSVSKADPVPSVPVDLKKLDEEDHVRLIRFDKE